MDVSEAPSPPRAFDPEWFELETDDRRISIRVSADTDPVTLALRITSADGDPVADVPVSLTAADGRPVELRTNAAGGVSLAIGPGESDVCIGPEPGDHLTVSVGPARVM
jgi:hypothetical protein